MDRRECGFGLECGEKLKEIDRGTRLESSSSSEARQLSIEAGTESGARTISLHPSSVIVSDICGLLEDTDPAYTSLPPPNPSTNSAPPPSFSGLL